MLTKPKPKPKPRDDPLAAMLRQKQQEDRRGVGMDARREAEEMLKREEAKGLVLSKGKGKADAIQKEMTENLLPGVTIVPAMVIAIEKAQAAGIRYNRQ